MKTVNIFLVALISISMLACKKYDEGGSKRKAEKNLKKKWKIETYYLNDNDATSTLLISNYTEEYKDNEVYTRAYVDTDGDNFSETGTWEFDSDKEQISLMGVSSIELTDETSTVSTSDYNIIKLTKDELWYSYENGGDEHEFHLVPN